MVPGVRPPPGWSLGTIHLSCMKGQRATKGKSAADKIYDKIEAKLQDKIQDKIWDEIQHKIQDKI